MTDRLNKIYILFVVLLVLVGGLFYFMLRYTEEPPQNRQEQEGPMDNENGAEEAEMAIQLYYYNPALDQGPGGAQCTRAGLVAVERTISRTITPLKASIELLLEGELTPQEVAQGITTEFPLSGVTLESVSIEDGVATLVFNDPESRTSGGACRAGVLWFQIEETAKQFPSVDSARFMPEELFQP